MIVIDDYLEGARRAAGLHASATVQNALASGTEHSLYSSCGSFAQLAGGITDYAHRISVRDFARVTPMQFLVTRDAPCDWQCLPVSLSRPIVFVARFAVFQDDP